MKPKILWIGLHPDHVDYSKFSYLTPEKLAAFLKEETRNLNNAGYDAQVCLIDRGQTAEQVIKNSLNEMNYQAIIIGAGIRTDKDCLILFEKIINIVHQYATQAKICFNTTPTDSVEAAKRWIY